MALCATALLMLSACTEPEVAKPLKRPEDVKRTKPAEKPSAEKKMPARKAPIVRSTPRAAEPAVTAAASPSAQPIAKILRALDMNAGSGVTSDTQQDCMALLASGGLQLDQFEIPFAAREVILEMKGQPAGNIWPEVELKMFCHDKQMWFIPWNRDYVTTSTFFEYRKPMNPPMAPGKYLIRFWYYNNTPVPEGQDRNVWLRRIIFVP